MPVQSTWFTRDLPVLEATISILTEPQHPGFVDVRTIAERAKMDAHDVFDAVRDMSGVYVDLQRNVSPDPNGQLVMGVTPAARIAVGQWPSVDILSERLLAAFHVAAQQESDPVQKCTLSAISDALTQMGQQVVVAVLSAAISGHHYGSSTYGEKLGRHLAFLGQAAQ
jgi:hypothetical protein